MKVHRPLGTVSAHAIETVRRSVPAYLCHASPAVVLVLLDSHLNMHVTKTSFAISGMVLCTADY